MLIDNLKWVSWNTFLAVIPVVLGYIIYNSSFLSTKRKLPKIVLIILGLAWLAFLPNTCYLLTEWRHFLDTVARTGLHVRWRYDGEATVALMNYTAFYFCYSAIGMFTFALAIRPMAKLAKGLGMRLWVWAMPLFLLLSLGVYLGLILRYNSWDLITRPDEVWASIAALSTRPKLSAFIVGFGAFLWLAYAAMDIWIDGLLTKWTEWRNRGKQPNIS